MPACVSDSLHLFQLLFVFDLFAYAAVFLDQSPRWSSVYSIVNFTMVGVVLLDVFLPNTEYKTDVIVSGAVLVLTLILFFVGYLVKLPSAVITTVAIMMLFGFTLHYAQEFAVDYFGASWGADLDTQTKLYALAAILAVVIVVMGVTFLFCELTRFFILSLVYSLVAMVCLRAMWYNGVLPARICCDADAPMQCPIYLSPLDYGVVLGLWWLRLMTYMFYTYYARSEQDLQSTRRLLQLKAKEQQQEVKPLLSQQQQQQRSR